MKAPLFERLLIPWSLTSLTRAYISKRVKGLRNEAIAPKTGGGGGEHGGRAGGLDG